MKTAIIIGGGIAGCATAYALAIRGIEVTLIERHNNLAQEASGNPIGVLYPRLIGKDTLSQFSLASFLWTQQFLKYLNLPPDVYQTCGMLQLAFNTREMARFEALHASQQHHQLAHLVNADQASVIAGVPITCSALHIPSAGWFNPVALCERLVQHERIKVECSHSALSFHQTSSGWQVATQTNLLDAEIVVLANANDVQTFKQTAHLPLTPVRGQITCLQATQASQQLKTVICSDGYMSPALNGKHVLGASFIANITGTEPSDAEDSTNLAMLNNMLPHIHAQLSTQVIDHRAAIRCTTIDHLPLAGPILDAKSLTQKPPRPSATNHTLPWLDGLFVNIGHGSKGLITAPYCAELIANMITGEPTLMDRAHISGIQPNRFILKALGLKPLIKTSALR